MSSFRGWAWVAVLDIGLGREPPDGFGVVHIGDEHGGCLASAYQLAARRFFFLGSDHTLFSNTKCFQVSHPTPRVPLFPCPLDTLVSP